MWVVAHRRRPGSPDDGCWLRTDDGTSPPRNSSRPLTEHRPPPCFLNSEFQAHRIELSPLLHPFVHIRAHPSTTATHRRLAIPAHTNSYLSRIAFSAPRSFESGLYPLPNGQQDLQHIESCLPVPRLRQRSARSTQTEPVIPPIGETPILRAFVLRTWMVQPPTSSEAFPLRLFLLIVPWPILFRPRSRVRLCRHRPLVRLTSPLLAPRCRRLYHTGDPPSPPRPSFVCVGVSA